MISKFRIMILGMICFASSAFGVISGQVDLLGPVGVQIVPGSSTWSARLPQPIQVSALKISFWNTGKCPVIPITSMSVKYVNDPYWYNTSYKAGSYTVEGSYMIEAVKADFYLDHQPEMCVIKISGTREISSPYGEN
jgi:hypothetical protein